MLNDKIKPQITKGKAEKKRKEGKITCSSMAIKVSHNKRGKIN